MDAEVHYAFPTAIFTQQLEDFKSINKIFLDNIEPYDFTSTGEVLTGEYLGKISMHHNPLFKDFYKIVSECARDYVDFLGMREDIFEYHFTKSWLSIIDKPTLHMRYHSHSVSDISWVYYVQVPENADAISFFNKHKPNELFSGFMDDGRDSPLDDLYDFTPKGKTFFKERNAANYTTFNVPPQEGMLILFPGKQQHGTIPHPDATGPQLGKRTAVVGDINLILKPGHLNFESGRINNDYMRTFD